MKRPQKEQQLRSVRCRGSGARAGAEPTWVSRPSAWLGSLAPGLAESDHVDAPAGASHQAVWLGAMREAGEDCLLEGVMPCTWSEEAGTEQTAHECRIELSESRWHCSLGCG